MVSRKESKRIILTNAKREEIVKKKKFFCSLPYFFFFFFFLSIRENDIKLWPFDVEEKEYITLYRNASSLNEQQSLFFTATWARDFVRISQFLLDFAFFYFSIFLYVNFFRFELNFTIVYLFKERQLE